ncbi:hypothetical protein B0H14DRAFT_2407898, partial [Mycena olivaceomarginata]
YDGVCSDPIAFGSLLDLDAPPKWKMHKYAVPELEEIMGFIKASVRCFFRARVSLSRVLITRRFQIRYSSFDWERHCVRSAGASSELEAALLRLQRGMFPAVGPMCPLVWMVGWKYIFGSEINVRP